MGRKIQVDALGKEGDKVMDQNCQCNVETMCYRHAAAGETYGVCVALNEWGLGTPGPDKNDLIAIIKMAQAAIAKADGKKETK